MKSSIFVKLLVVLVTVFTYCRAANIVDIIKGIGASQESLSDIAKELKDFKKDVEYYAKVKNIKRDISFNKWRSLDVYYDKNEKVDELKPVILYIYGGTWKKGNKIKYTKIGTLLEENDYIAVLPNYGVFPWGGMEDMVYDVYTAAEWTFKNIKKYGGDPNKVTICGHSAGAHLIALTLFKSYNRMLNNGKELAPLPHFEKVLFLAGPFDFDDIGVATATAELEEVEEVNGGMLETALSYLFRTKNVSPYDIVRDMPDNSALDSFNVGRFVFYYTTGDSLVPAQTAPKLIKHMKRVCPDINIQYIVKEGYEHSDIVNGVRFDDQEQIDIFMTLIRL
eukprot:jgi/Orpsp1_1/1184523/evm.model.c7180000089879.1